ncbi:MAG: shikimate dehydrogenase [Deltaproteobacteria bacterium]|nr:shikimate dehydrogenase [Deltaproteobacteria bacterium]|tara:strand:+ start:2101 stop:2961 length:861 start_codon:yes stop_codon:yes gene_type:complete
MRDAPISGHTQVFGLIGHPVRHSLSPSMYNALFARFGIDAVYLAFDVHPDHAIRVNESIRILGLVGVNLTVPFKERVLDGLDHMTIAAKEAGAVNVVTNVDGQLTGYNTDGEGFIRSLKEEKGPQPDGIHAIILGAGGAGRAVASALLDHGAQRITIMNRTLLRAQEAAKALNSSIGDTRVDAAELTAQSFSVVAKDAGLVVNCTSGPAHETINSLDPEVLSKDASWVDINYWMEHPPAVESCRSAGIRFHTGLGMLAHQGALAFELFTGYPVTGAEIRTFLLEKG